METQRCDICGISHEPYKEFSGSIEQRMNLIDSHMKDLTSQENKLRSESYHYEGLRETLLTQYIEEAEILKDTEWQIVAHDRSVSLDFYDNRYKHPSMLKMSDLLRMNHHDGFRFSDNISMNFDDDRVSLHFNRNEDVLPFIERFKLKVISSNVIKRLQDLKKQVSDLESVISQLQLKRNV